MQIREATPADAAAIARVRAEWQRGYLGGLLLAGDVAAEGRPPEGGLVLLAQTADGRVVGYARGGRLRADGLSHEGDLEYDGELYDLFVVNLPGAEAEAEARRDLTVGMARRLRAQGFRSLLAWGIDGGLTCAEYMRLGGVHLDAVHPRYVEQLRFAAYGWPDIAAVADA